MAHGQKFRRAIFVFTTVVLAVSIVFATGEIAVRIASSYSVDTRYLAIANKENKNLVFKNLKQYLESKPQISPYREGFNHWDNSLGFKDTEFESVKAPGIFRIIALGDSFTYGVVPYPDSVMTLLEDELKKKCKENNLELYNFAVPGTGVWDYLQIFELAHDTYRPDLVLVHLYLGNDGPSLYFQVDELPEGLAGSNGFRSYLATYLKNVYLLFTSVDMAIVNEGRQRANPNQSKRCAGCAIDPSQNITDESPILKNPLFSEEKWISEIGANELARFFVTDKEDMKRQWAPTLEILQTLVDKTRKADIDVAFIFYPSKFQVYPALREKFLEKAKGIERLKRMTPDKIDPMAPNRFFMNFCERTGIDCFDMTEPMIAAGKISENNFYRKRETHWLIEGNKVAAEIEARYVTKKVCP